MVFGIFPLRVMDMVRVSGWLGQASQMFDENENRETVIWEVASDTCTSFESRLITTH